ncbi:MAG: hypothetical protein AseanaTS_11540 [Candidatus Pelagadaptatus aseana]|uniref:response regulator n=1 Tax=Candidatus Pelagadaptatus aseana TaxID=3120508 RepID=UPI0039B1565D
MSQHILVVEDNPDNSKLVTWILEDEDYLVTCCETAEAGLEALQRQAFDAVLMDISLPGMDGKEATQHIRQQPQWQALPIIALTAHAVKGEHEAILASGVTDLITKPLDEELLISRLAELLN